MNRDMIAHVRQQIISISTREQSVYTQIEKFVQLVQFTHQEKLNELKNVIFKTLLQMMFPFLQKMAVKLYRFDLLIDKSLPEQGRRRSLSSDNPLLSEDILTVSGFLWGIILKYDCNRGVYFTHYMELQFEWYYKNLCRARMGKKRRKDSFHDDYKTVSYEEIIERNHEDENSYGIAKIGDMAYDDNFELITSEWSLREPQEFVEDESLFNSISSFTPKQIEVMALELEGYYQEQIAIELRKKGTLISQQAVSERLLGIKKKIDKIKLKRGVLHETRESTGANNYSA